MRDRILKKYDNGLTLVYKHTKAKQAVFFDIRFHSGLINDPQDKLGLSHFVEHSVGFSNNKYTNEQKNDFRMKLYYANFSTSRTYMRFYAYVSDEEFEETFAHYINNLTDFNISDQEFENEKLVITQEILRFRKDISAEMHYTTNETLYKDKNVRVRPFGTVETVNNITKQDLINYINNCFTLQNCQITVYGNVSFLKVKRLIKKYVLTAFNKKSSEKYLNIQDVVKYNDDKKVMVVNPSPDEGKSKITIIHKFHMDDINRYRGFATRILSNIYEVSAINYFREKFGLCYAAGIKFSRGLSIDNSHDVMQMKISVDCDQKNVKTVLEKLPEFYAYIKEYHLTDDSLEQAKTILRRYEKVSINKNIIQKGTDYADAEFDNTPYITYWQNKTYNKKKEKKTTLDFVKTILKDCLEEKPIILVVSNTTDTLPEYKDLCKELKIKNI